MPLGWDRASSRDWGDSKGVSFAHTKLVQFSSAQGKLAALEVAVPSHVTWGAINGAQL